MTEEQYAVEVEHVTKKFSMHSNSNTLKDLVVYHEKREKNKRTVLDDISFKVKKGEALGIIGRNGSGKSTLLKLLTKILKPNSGTIKTDGRIACLIELGAGFHPDMTGRENVYINASIFGMSGKTVEERFNDILQFSDIGEHIDERVRNYSSGMYLRLAFSVAINVDADILLIDEILAVGDLQFRMKCIDRLKEFKKNGGTIILVTHDTEQANIMCDNVMWIDDGHIREYGPAEKICENYRNFMLNK